MLFTNLHFQCHHFVYLHTFWCIGINQKRKSLPKCFITPKSIYGLWISNENKNFHSFFFVFFFLAKKSNLFSIRALGFGFAYIYLVILAVSFSFFLFSFRNALTFPIEWKVFFARSPPLFCQHNLKVCDDILHKFSVFVSFSLYWIEILFLHCTVAVNIFFSLGFVIRNNSFICLKYLFMPRIHAHILV